MTSIAPPGPRVLEMDIKEGEWFISDWFRIDAFTKAMVAGDSGGREDISSVRGREERTDRYWRDYGILHVSVGNSSPSILSRNGSLVFGRTSERFPDNQTLGSVCTDLWWVTMLPRTTLVGIVAEQEGPESAERIVRDHLKERSDFIKLRAEYPNPQCEASRLGMNAREGVIGEMDLTSR